MESEEFIDILNDLISINKDRIYIYEKGITELDKQDTSHFPEPVFEDRINESRVLVNELSGAVVRLDGQPQQEATPSGKLYRLWMDLKTAFTGSSTKSVLELCEYGEEAALKAYDKALSVRGDWPEEIFAMITRQKQILAQARDILKKYKDDLRRVNA